MSLIEDERNRRIKKYLNTNPQKGQELGQVMQGQNEIYGINSALQNNLAMEQAQAQAQQQTVGSLQQASELVAQMGFNYYEVKNYFNGCGYILYGIISCKSTNVSIL